MYWFFIWWFHMPMRHVDPHMARPVIVSEVRVHV